MNSNNCKIGAVVLTIILIGTAFFVPASSVKVNNINPSIEIKGNQSDQDPEIESFKLDRAYHEDPPVGPLNVDDNDDAGHKDDAGDEAKRSFPLYPGEMEDNWPGRGRTGKLSSDDEEDWYFFNVCAGQDVIVTLTPPSGFDFDLALWNEDEELKASSSNSGSTPESFTYTAEYTGTFFLQFKYISGTGEGQYTFDVNLEGQNDSGTGNDAADDFASATLISPGTYYGYLDMNDEEDWYKFNVNSGQGIHFNLEMRKITYLSDFDIYLYKPDGELAYYQTFYYDDELLYPADVSGEWRVKIDIFPGYTDIPQPTEWEYFTYGSGPYKLTFSLDSSAPSPPDPIPQPEIIPVAHTFNIANSPGSNVDEYGYLASIPACNYKEAGNRYLAPIVYNYDSTPTNWYGDVDDTTNYLLEDWNDYLASKGKSAVDYYVNSDPVIAAAEIATAAWDSSDLAVVAIDGSIYEDTTTEVLHKSATLPRGKDVQVIPSDSSDFISLGGMSVYPMTFINNKWGAISLEIEGSAEEPFLIGVYPHYMILTTDWWPEHVDEKTDTYYPLTVTGLTSVWAAGVGSTSGDWDLKITKLECDRYKINVDDTDSVLKAELTTTTSSDLVVFLVDPDGNVRAPDISDWNGGEIRPIHGWNGIDDPDYPPDCNDWRDWIVAPHKDFTAEVLHPEKGEWTVIVVPRYSTGSSIKYTLSVKIRDLNQKRVDAAISAANAAVIASQEHAPLLYVREDSVPTETQNAFDELGVEKVIFVQRDGIGSGVENSLPTLEANLKTMKSIVDYIKDYSHTENYITITSLKTGEGFFAPASMLAAYHCSPVLRIGEAPGNPAALANKIDTWRLWDGDYYHGNRAPGHLPIHTEPIDPMDPDELFLAIIDYLGGGSTELPPLGQDAKRFWNAEMHDAIESYIQSFGLDVSGEQEAYVFVAPRKDIRIEAHSVMIGLNSYAGFIPGDTPAYTSSLIAKNILYPALIYANSNRDVTTAQLMNFPDGGTPWKTNDGESYTVYSSRVLKNTFMSHDRIFDSHIIWDAHLERMNDGVSVMYYSGHGTGGSGMSAQYLQTDFCNYPEVEWYDAWRGYSYDNWDTPRNNGRVWYNPEPENLYDIIHYKWIDQLLDNLRSAAIFYMSCSTGQQFGPMVYLDHGAVMWYGNAGSGICPQADLLDDWFFEDAMINGLCVGEAYSKHVWLHHRDFTIPEGDPKFDLTMYGKSSLYRPSEGGITTVHCIYGDPKLILYSPEWTAPNAIDSIITESNNQPPLPPTINGPNRGTSGKSYTYTFETTDPNNDDIYYYVDWGDGNFEDWDGPFNSGQGSSASHTWSSNGVYKVKVRAKDSNGVIGPWGTLEINVPRARTAVNAQFMGRVLKFFPILEHIGQILIRLMHLL